MGLFEKPAISYAENVKLGGMFGKKYTVSVELYEDKLAGQAFQEETDAADRNFTHVSYEIPFDKVVSISMERISSRDGIAIEYKYDMLSLYDPHGKKKIVLWGLKEPQTVKEDIERICWGYVDEKTGR